MKDLILRTKLEVLKQSLGQVESVVDSVQKRRAEILKLLELLSVEEQVDQLTNALNNINFMQANSSGLSKSIQESLEVAQEAISKVKDKLKAVQQATERLQGVNAQIQEDTLSSQLSSIFRNSARNRIINLQEIYNIREKAEFADKNGDASTAETLLQEAWRQYTNRVRESQPIFKEYIDFLGGLALRDTYVDAGTYLIADKFIQTWAEKNDARWNSLTIPAREDAIDIGPARMIRLGFPEWSIWALPLTAYGFWHVLKGADSWKEHIELNPPDRLPEDYLHNYLADAFATCTMGPAYACAAILLRFNPISPSIEDDAHPASIKRAYVVISMLKKMDEEGKHAFTSIIERLEGEWKAALQQVKQSPDDTLSDSDKEELDYLVNYFWTFLYSFEFDYPYTSWRQIEQEWPRQLLDNKEESINTVGLADLRNVLNAAWLCRLDHPDKTDEIARTAMRLWNIILDRKISEGGGKSTVGANIDTRSSKRG